MFDFDVPADWINETVNVALKVPAIRPGELTMMQGRLVGHGPGILQLEIRGSLVLLPKMNVQHLERAARVATGVVLAGPGSNRPA